MIHILWSPNARLMVGADCLRPNGCGRIKRELLGDWLAGWLAHWPAGSGRAGRASRAGGPAGGPAKRWLASGPPASWLADWLALAGSGWLWPAPPTSWHCLAPPWRAAFESFNRSPGWLAGRLDGARGRAGGQPAWLARSQATSPASCLAGGQASVGWLAGWLGRLLAGSLAR